MSTLFNRAESIFKMFLFISIWWEAVRHLFSLSSCAQVKSDLFSVPEIVESLTDTNRIIL